MEPCAHHILEDVYYRIISLTVMLIVEDALKYADGVLTCKKDPKAAIHREMIRETVSRATTQETMSPKTVQETVNREITVQETANREITGRATIQATGSPEGFLAEH